MNKRVNRNSQSSLARGLWVTFKEFAANTGLHGLKYITEDGRRPLERILWLLVVAGGMAGAGIMASNFWQRFTTAPTRASVETNHFPSWRLPFPATTLCNVNRIFRSKVERLLDRLGVKEDERREGWAAMKMLLELVQPEPDNSTYNNKTAKIFQKILKRNNVTLRNVMSELDLSCYELLERCMWQGDLIDCSKIFEERKSYLGFCCSFNYRGVIEVQKNGKKMLEMAPGTPRHSRYYSKRMGLSVIINPYIDDYYLSTFNSAGIRMLIHRVDDYPDEAAEEKILPVGREMLVGVTPFSSFCTDAVRAVDPLVRQCVFEDEKELQYFPIYSATNCLTECRMNYAIRFCDCSPFYYHEVDGIRICDIGDIPCLNAYYFALRTRRSFILEEMGDDYEAENTSISCDCPPLCNQVDYKIQVSNGDFKAVRFQRSPLLDGANVTTRTLLHFYLNNHVSVRTKRDVVSSWNDLLSSLGGVFSLFLGCSFMTVIEVVYFFTLRLGLHYRRLAAPAANKEENDDHWHEPSAAPDAFPGHAPARKVAYIPDLSLWKVAR